MNRQQREALDSLLRDGPQDIEIADIRATDVIVRLPRRWLRGGIGRRVGRAGLRPEPSNKDATMPSALVTLHIRCVHIPYHVCASLLDRESPRHVGEC
jgi:hypothetical protein